MPRDGPGAFFPHLYTQKKEVVTKHDPFGVSAGRDGVSSIFLAVYRRATGKQRASKGESPCQSRKSTRRCFVALGSWLKSQSRALVTKTRSWTVATSNGGVDNVSASEGGRGCWKKSSTRSIFQAALGSSFE